MNKIRLLLLISLIMSLSGCTPRGCSFLPKTSLTIIQYHLEKGIGEEGELIAQIEGVARNDGSTKLEYAEIKGKFYDNEGALLYSGVAKTTNLGLGQMWEFTISYPESSPEPAEEVDHVTVKVGTLRGSTVMP